MNKIILLLAFIAQSYASTSHLQVSVVLPKQETMSIDVDVQGTVEEQDAHIITAPYEGVLHVRVLNLQKVKRGQLIATIENTDMRSGFALSKNETDLLKAQYTLEKQKEKSSAEMLKMGLISNNDYLAEQALVNDKKIAYITAVSKHGTLKKQLQKSSIVAPISGYVTDLLTQGTAVSYGMNLCKILGGRQIIRLYVPSYYISSMHEKQKLKLIADANEIDATITQILPKTTDNLVEVIASTPSQLPSGLNIGAKIPLKTVKGWVIPKESVVLIQNRPAVYIIQNNVAHLHFIKIQKDLVNKVLVTDDLHKNDKIAYENAYMLDEDMQVEIVK